MAYNTPQIPQDKANHVIFGWLIFFISNLFLNVYISFSIVLVFATLKEVYDEFYRFGFDYKDLLSTLIIPLILTLKSIL